jgi:hypothetical protein
MRLVLTLSEGKRGTSFGPTLPFGSDLCAGAFSPHVESFPHCLTVLRSGPAMMARSKVLRNGTIHCEKTLHVSRGLEPLPPLLALARGLWFSCQRPAEEETR